MKKFITDILQEQNAWSLGRICLLGCVTAFFMFLLLICTKIKIQNISDVLDAIEWLILLFASYVFGSKGIVNITDLISKLKNKV